MKKSMKCKSWMLLAMAAVSTLGFQSCLDDDDDHYAYQVMVPNAIVTVKTTAEDDFFLQLDDTTTLLPVNITTSPFGKKEVRALTNFTPVDQPAGGYTQAVHVNWIDSILTKPMAPDLGLQNDSVYGTDPVEIVNDWVTIAEDGYLTLRFRTAIGDQSSKHFINLLKGDEPYEVIFRHNAFGSNYGPMGDGLVAFKLDSLPDTEGKTVKLKLVWESYSGEKTAEFNYCSRKSTPASASIASERSTLNMR